MNTNKISPLIIYSGDLKECIEFRYRYNRLLENPIAKEILENLDIMFQEINASIEKLNAGGCGVFAYYMSKKFKEVNIPHQILVSDTFRGEHWDWETRNLEYLNGNINTLSCSHVFIKLWGLMFDGYGWLIEHKHRSEFNVHAILDLTEGKTIIDNTHYDPIVGEFDFNLLKCSAIDSNGAGWNPKYNRTQNEIIETIIENRFN